ncbi:uronyl 2-sulfotransferase-like [Asterias rubens]|uniref:uronyl 2-sulfotransferase-like n=1 Tax=Asterias rubens TaxID=7604 RepID=UPI0014552615|nr:uronyl 2-sulfotransferase-like [Asterias rubens]
MEAEENSCLSRLPRRRAVLVTLVAIAATLTLFFVNMTGQWVGQSVTQLAKGPGRNRNHFGAAFDEMRTHDKKNNKGGLNWPSKDPRPGSKKWQHDKDLLLEGAEKKANNLVSSASSFTGDFPESPDTGAPDFATSWRQTIKTNYHAAVDKTGTVIQGAKRGGPTKLPHSDKTGRILQATIRSEMKKIAQETSSNRTRSKRNLYEWNDRDRLAYKKLPLRNETDTNPWERKEAIIFNRVGKCGSRSVIDLLRKLSSTNDFNFISSIVYNETDIGPARQKHIATTLDQVRTPYLFQRHLHFFNFSQFGAREPLYINIIRDPLARMVSAYYFKRFGDGKSNQNFKGTEEEKNRSVTDCILQSHFECSARRTHYIIPFFCGQAKRCRYPSQWSLDQAKENVEQHFIAVGVLEDLDNSFRVFEKLLPRYFTGSLKLFKEPDKNQVIRNSSTVTKKKEKPSPEAEAVMKGRMHYEYEFYFFVKARLEKLKIKYGIEDVR